MPTAAIAGFRPPRPICSHEANVGAVVVAYRDVTDQKHAEEEARRAATLASAASLAAALGHEVSNPLTALTLNLEASLRELSSENPQEARAHPDHRARFRTAHRGDCRGPARARSGKEHHAGAGRSRSRPRTSRGAHQLPLGTAGQDRRPAVTALHVLGEESNLVTMFTNLLANAREAEPFGRSGQVVNVRVAVEPNDRVLIEVEDSRLRHCRRTSLARLRTLLHDQTAAGPERPRARGRPDASSSSSEARCRSRAASAPVPPCACGCAEPIPACAARLGARRRPRRRVARTGAGRGRRPAGPQVTRQTVQVGSRGGRGAHRARSARSGPGGSRPST